MIIEKEYNELHNAREAVHDVGDELSSAQNNMAKRLRDRMI